MVFLSNVSLVYEKAANLVTFTVFFTFIRRGVIIKSICIYLYLLQYNPGE